MNLYAEDSSDAQMKALDEQIAALQIIADAATKKAKDNPTKANKDAAEEANYAVASAVVDAAILSAYKTVEAAESESEETVEPTAESNQTDDNDRLL